MPDTAPPATPTDYPGDLAAYRPRLFGIAYRMLGSVTDAEDAVQEAFLRWQQARERGEVIVAPEGWLVTVVTRLCIDQLRTARTRRESYIGPWLPEPLVDAGTVGLEETAEMAESLSLAFLVLLERLSPVERAVFLLHEVFGYPYAEIAPVVGRQEDACRQLARRARTRIGVGRPRFRASRAQGARLANAFLRACQEGDLPGLLALLTEDVELVADGGGQVGAARKPVRGVDLVTRFLLGIVRLAPVGWRAEPATVNGGPGLVVRHADGRPFAVLALTIAGDRISGIQLVNNPAKLQGIPTD
jgi:RNA polymerase sigma-70 factor (ECF subfamily)